MAVGAGAHVGDRLIPIYELPSSDLPELDDLSLSPWEQIVPAPSLESMDFTSTQVGMAGTDDLAARVYLAWHGGTRRVYLAVERVDDIYSNEYAGGDAPFFTGADHLQLLVDGDHSGGQFACGPEDATVEQARRFVGAQAQFYAAVAESPDGVRFGYEGAANAWASRPPWADFAVRQLGVEPTQTRMQLYVTPWDDLNWVGPEASVPSRLAPGRILGLQLALIDRDLPGGSGIRYEITSLRTRPGLTCYAENFVDALLLPCDRGDCSRAPESAVRADAWARIKAGL